MTAPPVKPNDDPNRSQHYGSGSGQPPGPMVYVENQNCNAGQDETAVTCEINRGTMQYDVAT